MIKIDYKELLKRNEFNVLSKSIEISAIKSLL